MARLVRKEAGSSELAAWLNDRPDETLVSSALVEVEVPRALRRSAPQSLIGVPTALARLYKIEIDATIRATAGAYTDPLLRSLDAIQLATAQVLAAESEGALSAFVTYDKRLLAAASAAGMPTASPGG